MIRSLAADDDREAWLDVWRRTGREPFAHPDFVSLFAGDDGTPMALFAEQEAGCAMLPLVCRPVPPPLGHGTDAVSPYGYGGPFASGDPDWFAFWTEVVDWMRSTEVVAAFVRASLGTDVSRLDHVPGARALHLADNVSVDLTRPDDVQWRHVAHKVRKNVNKARRAELCVRVSNGFSDLSSFLSVYRSTMQRRNADPRYSFDADFFEALGTIEDCCLVADVLDVTGRVLSTEIVLVSDDHYYSFLGGTLEEAFPHAPNDLLKLSVMEHGHAAGRSRYVLGGGYRAGDGIYRYKLAFDADGVVPFHGIQLIGDQERYDALTARSDALHGPVGMTDRNYFPAYRRP